MLQSYLSEIQLIGQNKNGYIIALVDGDGMIVCLPPPALRSAS